MNKGQILWFTGVSGSGKTTVSNLLCEELRKLGRSVRILDGDDIRSKRHKHLKFTADNIRENNRLILELCLPLQCKYDYILVPVIAPFCDSRKVAREKIGNTYIEVYVEVSLETAIKRDVKGLYKKALNGQIENFIGIDPNVPYEKPINPDIVLHTEAEDINDSVAKILNFIKKCY